MLVNQLMAESFAVSLDRAVGPLVLSLDVGSTGTRGGLFDATGRPILKTRIKVDHAFRSNTAGRSEISPDQIVHEVAAVLDAIAGPQYAGLIRGVAMDTFASSLIGVDEDHAAVTPCYTYADSRSAPQVEQLRKVLDEEELQQRTGTRLHTSYLPGRLRWIQNTQPDTFELVRSWMSLGEYIYLRLLGVRGVAVSAAAWSGLLDRRTGEWDDELLTRIGVRPDQFAPPRNPDDPFTKLPKRLPRRWPGLAGAVWFAAIPDGFAANLGSGALDEHKMAFSASTSGALRVMVPGVPDHIPAGLWCYRIDADRSMVGGALNDVGAVVSWLDALTAPPFRGSRDDWFAGPPRDASPLMLPFLTGERSTGWRGDARAVIAEITSNTDVSAFYRGAMEGVAMSYRRVVEELETVAPGVERIVAAGGITQLMPNWMTVVASVLDKPVFPITMKRSTLRGTALLALDTLAPTVARAEPEAGELIVPNSRWVAEYNRRYQRYLALYTEVFP